MEEIINIAKFINDPKVILIIGANEGQEIDAFRNIYPLAKIICFEPYPGAFKICARYSSDNVLVVNSAIGNEDGELDFYPSQTLNGDPWNQSGSLRKPTSNNRMYGDLRFGNPIKVTCWKLDTWCEQNNINPDLIWSDMQGSEIDLIRGGNNILKNVKALYAECTNRALYEGEANLRELSAALLDLEWFDIKTSAYIYRHGDNYLFINRKIVNLEAIGHC